MLIRYLISNRLRVNLTSKHGFKYVTKRLFLFKRLFKTSRLIESLRRKGAQIAPFTIINLCAFEGKLSNLKIGKGSFIGNNSFIQLHANVTIGENVVINDSVKILTGSHKTNSPEWELIAAPVSIGDYAWIATSAIILPGICIGEGAVVAAGSVVTKNVDAFSIVGGNPAKMLKKRNITEFNYCPARSSALVEAWMGR